MDSDDLIERVLERVADRVDTRLVFGEPIVSGTRTVIPVARVSYGFGAGTGHGFRRSAAAGGELRDHADRGDGSGAGGGVVARPVGALEISYAGTRFIDFGAGRRLAGVFFAGLAVGLGVMALQRRSR